MSARLSVVDEIFLRTHRGWGDPVVMQGLWRCPGRVEPALLEEVRATLAHGRLGRGVVRSRVPLARPRFVVDSSAHPIDYRTIASSTLLEWADEQAALDVDPETGPGWRMFAAYLDDGGTVVSLVCSHVIADARGLISAIADALAGNTRPPTPDRDTSDVRDALALTTRVTWRTATAVAGLVRHPSRRRELKSAEHTSAPPRVSCTRVIAEIDASDWTVCAARDGGTSNSLFLSVVAELARMDDTEPVALSIPMDVRSSDGVDNAIAMVEVTVSPHDTTGHIRDASRAAYDTPPMSSPAGFPEELLQVVPDRLAHKLASSPGERDALCSNIGRIPETVRTLGPHRATGVATRAVHPHKLATHTRIFAFLNEFDGRFTLSLESTVDHDLRNRTIDVLTRRGLRPRLW